MTESTYEPSTAEIRLTAQEIHALLQSFQNGYTHRDLSQLDAFMDLFTPEFEIIGTNGIKPGADEWYTMPRSSPRPDQRRLGNLGRPAPGCGHLHRFTPWAKSAGSLPRHRHPDHRGGKLRLVSWASSRSSSKNLRCPPNKNCTTSCAAARTPSTNCGAVRRSSGRCVLRRWSCAETMAGSSPRCNFSFPTTHFPDVRIQDSE